MFRSTTSTLDLKSKFKFSSYTFSKFYRKCRDVANLQQYSQFSFSHLNILTVWPSDFPTQKKFKLKKKILYEFVRWIQQTVCARRGCSPLCPYVISTTIANYQHIGKVLYIHAAIPARWHCTKINLANLFMQLQLICYCKLVWVVLLLPCRSSQLKTRPLLGM
jgi:hypothetical protein